MLIIAKKDILNLGKGPTDRLDDPIITAQAEYFITFMETKNKFCLSLNYNGSKSFLFVLGV